MSNPQFPTLALTNGGQDSKFYSEKLEDPSMKTTMEGGYVASRARHTRPPRITFTTGFSSISDADRKTLRDFWASVGGGSVIFDWQNPVDGITYAVRFAAEMQFKYVGIGETKLWDCQITLEQA